MKIVAKFYGMKNYNNLCTLTSGNSIFQRHFSDFFWSFFLLRHTLITTGVFSSHAGLPFWSFPKAKKNQMSLLLPYNVPPPPRGVLGEAKLAHEQRWITCSPWRFSPNRAMQGTRSHQGVPSVDSQHLMLSTGVSDAETPGEGGTGHFEGYRPAKRCWSQ